MTIEITRENFTEAMRQAVAEKGEDFVYSKPDPDGECVYSHNGQPSCLIGHALHNLGVPLDPEWDDVNAMSAASLLRSLGVGDQSLFCAASNAQDAQDCQEPWGEAFQEYLATLESYDGA